MCMDFRTKKLPTTDTDTDQESHVEYVEGYEAALLEQLRWEQKANRDAAKHGGYSTRYRKSL